MSRLRTIAFLLASTAAAWPLATPRVSAGAPGAQAVAVATRTTVVPPEQHFGFRMGADGRLATWPQIEQYFTDVAEASDRVELVRFGTTTERQQLIAAIVSAPENIRRLPAIQDATRRLADPRTIAPDEARRLASDTPAVVAIGASIHASEVGATQTMNELLYLLATTTAPDLGAALQRVVVILIPSLNPDGHRLVVDWFERTRGTAFEGAPMPWLYHKYAGHDINRDAFMMNLAESRALAHFFYTAWHPQVFLSMHQMGPNGPRMFVPPNYDPIDTNYDPLIWRTAGLLGHAMALALEEDGRAGVVQNALFDYFWPGYEDSAPLGHNTVCLLAETASARTALPIDVRPEELAGSPRGLADYRAQINFPHPWPGGRWRLRDIVDYELVAARGLLVAAARYAADLVWNAYTMADRAIEQGRRGGPFAFVVPPGQHDPNAAARLVDLLLDGGVEVHHALEPFRGGGREYPPGTDLVLMAQPFRAYAKTLLERQEYPGRRVSPGGAPERPYDVAGWTLPLQMGVGVETVAEPFTVPALERLERAVIAPASVSVDANPSAFVLEAPGTGGALAVNRLLAGGLAPAFLSAPFDVNGHTYPAGAVLVHAARTARAVVADLAASLGLRADGIHAPLPAAMPIGRPRTALYKPWVENIDEGWTRLLLERFGFRFSNVDDAAVRAGSLRRAWDVIILPHATPDRLTSGHGAGTVPPEYVGGLGEAGVAALASFVREGGALVCLGASCGVPIDALHLPVEDLLKDEPPERFFCPGSILRLEADVSHPLGFGLQADTAAFFAFSSAYGITAPPTASGSDHQDGQDDHVTVVARYGNGDPLLSGWLEGGALVAGKPAVVEVRHGAGRVVLVGFRAQHRAQSLATVRLLFNAIFTTAGPDAGR